MAVCTSCEGKLGAVVLHEEFNGYGEDAKDLTSAQSSEIFDVADGHLQMHPDHNVHIIYGHKENIVDPSTGCSKVVYSHGSSEE